MGTDLDVSKISDTKMDPTGKYILTTRCRTGRSVRGFRLPPCCSFEERRDIERVIVKGLMKLEGDLAGEYFPLAGMHVFDYCLTNFSLRLAVTCRETNWDE